MSAPVEAVPLDSRQNCRNLTVGKDGECVHCYAKAGRECQYEPTSDDALSDRYVEQRNEIARLTAELADEKAVVDVLRSELQDRLQKQRAAEAELREAREEAALPMSETALEAAAKVMAEAFDYPWEHMPTVGRINMRTIAKNVIDAAMTKAKP